MRHAGFLFALCCAALCSDVLAGGVVTTYYNDSGVVYVENGKNYINYTTTEDGNGVTFSGVECNNTINGVSTSATDVGGGAIQVRGCGNKVANVTTVRGAPANVSIYGSNNDVENDVLGAAVWVGEGAEPAVLIGTGAGSGTNGNTVVNNVVGEQIFMQDASNNLVSGNTAEARLMVLSSSNNTVVGNEAATYGIKVRGNSWNNKVINNAADYIEIGQDFHADVESNQADYQLSVDYVNNEFNPRKDGPAVGDFQVDAATPPVIQACGASFDETLDGGVECNATLPAGHMLSAGTGKIPGANCTGNTYVAIVLASDQSDVKAAYPILSKRRSLLSPQGPSCAFVSYVNDGDADLAVTIKSSCTFTSCTGTTVYSITSMKTTAIKNNMAYTMHVAYATSDEVESNVADYSIEIGQRGQNAGAAVQGVAITNNSANSFRFISEQNTVFKQDIFDHNQVDAVLNVSGSNNLTVVNNTGAHSASLASRQSILRRPNCLRSECFSIPSWIRARFRLQPGIHWSP